MKIETMTAWNEEDLKEQINRIGKENFVKFESSWNGDYYTIWYWKEDVLHDLGHNDFFKNLRCGCGLCGDNDD